MTCKGLGRFPGPLSFVRGLPRLFARSRPSGFGATWLWLLPTAIVCVAQSPITVRRIAWADTEPVRQHLSAHRIDESTFAQFVERTHQENAQRVRLGDLDHLVFYVLQSKQFTRLAPIEPALSAKALVDAMDDRDRQAYLHGATAPAKSIPRAAAERIDAFVRMADLHGRDERLRYFRDLVASIYPSRPERHAGVIEEYLRVMRFVYEKEFVAQRAERPADAVANLYRSRGLSTDTAVEAGFVVYNGIGMAAAVNPSHPVRRVLIVGPGLDLAPRTAFLEGAPPQSYQPWAVLDALTTFLPAKPGIVEIVAADINPRVVSYLRRVRDSPLELRLSTELRDADGVTIRADFREYFGLLGRSIDSGTPAVQTQDGHLTKTLRLHPVWTRAISAERLDIVTERLDGKPFDLVVATNILPYFDDTQLALALANIAAMTAPGGVFLHNERRPVVEPLTAALGLPFEGARTVTIADVRNAPPLFDSVFLHRKK